MPSQLQDPDVYDEEAENQQGYGQAGLGPGHGTAAGDPSDPRGQPNSSGQTEAAGDPSDPRGQGPDRLGQAGLRDAESNAGPNAIAGQQGAGPQAQSPGVESPDDLRDMEEEPEDQFLGDEDPRQKQSRRQRAKSFAKRNQSKIIAIGSSVFTGIISTMIAVLSFIPLKIEHMVQNLESHFTAPISSALEATNNILLKKYIVKYVIPDYKNCGTTIDTKCKVRIVGGASNPVTNLYRGWAKERIETRLATKYKIELHFDKASSTWLLKGPGTAGKGDSIGAHGEKIDQVFGRKAFRNATISALETESQFKEIYYRFIIGSYMGRVDGIKRCIFYCGTRESIRGSVEDMKFSAKYWLAENVLQPRSELTAVAIKCLLDPSCQPDHTTANGEDPPTSDFDKQTTTTLESLAAQNNITDLAKLKEIHAKMSERGFQKYLIDQILQTVFKQQTSERISNAIPVLGWINLAAEIVKNANEAGPKIKKLSYAVEVAAAIKFFMAYQSYASEIHTGQVDPVEVGSWNDTFGPGLNSSTDPLVGGTASAEQAPLYNSIMTGTPSTTVASNYLCNNGIPPPANTACPEEMLGGGYNITNAIHAFLNEPGIGVIVTIANAWHDSIGAIFDFANSVSGTVTSVVGSIAEHAVEVGCVKVDTPFGSFYPIAELGLPGLGSGICDVRDKALAAAPKIIHGIVNVVLPNPWGTNMGGGRSWTLAAQGAQGYGLQGCDQIGCKNVSGPVAAAILNQQTEEAKQQFDSQPFFARMFDTNNTRSLVSQLAMATPIDLHGSVQTGFASLLSDPFSAFTHSFGAIFPWGRAAAAGPTADPDPFGGGDKAFPTKDIPPDLEKYWDDTHCDDTSDNGPIAKWQAAAADTKDPNTGEPVHTTVEPCLLIEHDVGAVGGKDNTSLLNPEDLAGVNGTGGGGSTAPTTPTTPAGGTIDTAHLYDDSTSVACAANTKDIGVYDGYTGGNKVKIRLCAISNLPSTGEEANNGYGVSGAGGKCPLNSRVSGVVYSMVQAAQKDGVTLATNSCFRTMSHQQALWIQDGQNPVRVAKPGTSNHQMGLAMDISGLPSTAGPVSGNSIWTWLSKNASNFGYKNYPAEAWHWSPTGN